MHSYAWIGLVMLGFVLVAFMLIVVVAVANIIYRCLYFLEKRITSRVFSAAAPEKRSSRNPSAVWDRDLDHLISLPPSAEPARPDQRKVPQQR